MGIPRKGRRTVEFNGEKYGWYIRRKGTYAQAICDSVMVVAIQKQDPQPTTPCALIVELSITRPDNLLSPHQTGVRPQSVKEMIAAALQQGWNPDAGKQFKIGFGIIKHTC